MSAGPYPAFRGTICDSCEEHVIEGEPIYLVVGDKLCRSCADEGGYVCNCGKYKADEYDQCYTCNENDRGYKIGRG